MAGFCRSCGSPLGDGQGFCAKCGAAVAGTPVQAATPAQSAAPGVAAPGAASATASTGSPVVKIVLIIVGVLFLFGALGIGAVVYVGYRVRQKAREMGLSLPSERRHASTLRGVDGCQWLSKDDVSQAIGMPVVRAEAQTGEDAGCAYSVVGDAGELTMKHAAQLTKKQMSKADQQAMEKASKGDQAQATSWDLRSILQGKGAPSDAASSEHPGETPALAFTVDENNAQFQMNLNKGLLSRLGPMATTNVPDLGDEAFDAAGAILFVRKGDKLLRITYTQCPCGLDEILPLARTVAGHL